MLGNYFLTAWRGILREPFFAAVNVCGLAVGLACCILMLLFVRHETGYDKSYKDADRLYQIRIIDKDGKDNTGFTLGMLQDFLSAPGSGVEAAAGYYVMYRPLHFTTTATPEIFTEDYVAVADNFFRLLNRPFVAGNADDALARPDSVVITRSLARSLFGTDQVLGQVLTTDVKFPLTVQGVIEDFPASSHLHQRVFINFLAKASITGSTRDLAKVAVKNGLIRLSPSARIGEVSARLDAAYRTTLTDPRFKPMDPHLRTRPLSEVHLADTALQIMGSNGKPAGSLSNRNLVIAATFLAVLVLVIAISNFINMTIARSQQRRREIATRKALGASRTQLIFQYLAEALVLTLIAAVVAISLVEILLPAFDVLVDRPLTTAPLLLPDMMTSLILLILAVALLAGLYPAWVLSNLPAIASQAIPVRNRHFPLRQVLVFGQFFVTSFLIVIAMTAHRQVELFRNRDFGFDTNVHVAAVEFGSWNALLASMGERYGPRTGWTTMALRIQSELARQPAIADVSISTNVPGNYPPGEPSELVRVGIPNAPSVPVGVVARTDGHFAGVFSPPLLAGRNFSSQHPGDETRTHYRPSTETPWGWDRIELKGGAILLTASAAHKLGFRAPQSALGARLTYGGRVAANTQMMENPVYTVIGVTGDMLMGDALGGMPVGGFILNDERGITFVIKPRPGRETKAAEQTKETLKRLAPDLVISVDFLPDMLERSLKPLNRLTIGFVGYALLAIVISCLGLYAMTAFVVARRAREIGVRKVLGATTGQLTSLLGWDLTRPVVFALVLALPAGFYAGNYLLQPFTDRISIGFSILGLTALISLLMAWLTVSRQALRLAATSPHELLRYE